MLYWTSRSAFHLATSWTADGWQILYGKQGNASIYLADGWDFVFNPRLQSDPIYTIAINNWGTNYVVDWLHTIDWGGWWSTARVQITSVSSWVVTWVQLIDIGKDYSDTIWAATSQESVQMGWDDNLTLDITVNWLPWLKVLWDIKIGVDNWFLWFGIDNDTTLTHVADTALLLNSTRQLQFNNSSSYINDDGTDMNIVTDWDLQITCWTNKTVELQETVYEDINFEALNLRLGASAPDLINILGSWSIYALAFDGAAITEEIHAGWEILHGYKEGTDINIHFHWMPTNTGAWNVKWQFEYSWVNIDGTFSAPTIVSVVDATNTTAWQHLKSNEITITWTGKTIWSHIVFRIFRDPTDALDTYASDAVLLSAGLHYQIDTMWSRQINTK
jgi:hypothetical protein